MERPPFTNQQIEDDIYEAIDNHDSGASIEDIKEQVNRARPTIKTHLATLIMTGRVTHARTRGRTYIFETRNLER